jgi:hypothetical protein
MDFGNVIYQGVADRNNKKDLKAYFVREYKKAERDFFYNPETFFPPLWELMKNCRTAIEKEFAESVEQFKLNIEKAKKGQMRFALPIASHVPFQEIDTAAYQKEQNEIHYELWSKQFDEFTIYKVHCSFHFRKLFLGDIELIESKLRDAQQQITGAHQQTEIKNAQTSIEIKPVFKPDGIQQLYDILREFFSSEQQTELRQILETGGNVSEKLLFKSNGNRLTDTFKKLIEHDIITGCHKRHLINWIISNFTFLHQGHAKTFVYDTVEKTISRNFYPCKSPLIEIKHGQIERVEHPRKRKKNNS